MASAQGKTRTGGKSESKAPRGRKPIAAHPLFSAYVALWFAALLGLSSLAVGVPNLERAVVALNLQLYLPAAAPPLGMTARALIAAGTACVGAMLGFLVASLFTPKKAKQAPAPKPAREPFKWPSLKRDKPEPTEPPVAVRARDTHPDAPVRRPIFAHEEFGESGEAEDVEAVQDMEALRAARLAEPDHVDLVLPSFLRAEPKPEVAPESEAEPAPVVIDVEPVEVQAAPLEAEIVEPEAVEPAPVEEAAEAAAPVVAQEIPHAPFDLAPGVAADRIASAELAELSPVELLERFAIALQRRQDRSGAPISDEQAARVTAIGEAALAMGREALAALDGTEPAKPAAIQRPVAVERPAAIELPSLRKSAAKRAAKKAAAEQALAEDEVEDVAPEIALKRFVTKKSAAKAVAEPVALKQDAAEAPKGLAVVPPKAMEAEADDPDETEKALREALAALQRMTGTA